MPDPVLGFRNMSVNKTNTTPGTHKAHTLHFSLPSKQLTNTKAGPGLIGSHVCPRDPMATFQSWLVVNIFKMGDFTQIPGITASLGNLDGSAAL